MLHRHREMLVIDNRLDKAGIIGNLFKKNRGLDWRNIYLPTPAYTVSITF